MKTKILITGSRHYGNLELVKKHFIDIAPDIVVHGRALGADACAHFAAEDVGGIEIRPYPAGTQSRSERNAAMVTTEHQKREPITLCLAFPTNEDSEDVWDCITRCLAAGIDVELGDDDDPAVVKKFNALVKRKKR